MNKTEPQRLGRNKRRAFQRAMTRKRNPVQLHDLTVADLFGQIVPRPAAESFEQFVNERLGGKLSNMFGHSFFELMEYAGMGDTSRNSIAAVYEIARRIALEKREAANNPS